MARWVPLQRCGLWCQTFAGVLVACEVQPLLHVSVLLETTGLFAMLWAPKDMRMMKPCSHVPALRLRVCV